MSSARAAKPLNIDQCLSAAFFFSLVILYALDEVLHEDLVTHFGNCVRYINKALHFEK